MKPLQLEIGAQTWTIRFVHKKPKGVKKGTRWYGETRYWNREILILICDPEIMFDSTMHEIQHAWWFAGGREFGPSKKQEKFIRWQTPLLCQMLKQMYA